MGLKLIYVTFHEILTRFALLCFSLLSHVDVTKWKHLPHYWPFVRGIHRGIVICFSYALEQTVEQTIEMPVI